MWNCVFGYAQYRLNSILPFISSENIPALLSNTMNIYIINKTGRIIDGFDALDQLEKLAVNPKTYKPLVEKKINNITIHANPLAT